MRGATVPELRELLDQISEDGLEHVSKPRRELIQLLKDITEEERAGP